MTPTIEATIKYIERILGRSLTGEEILILGLAFQEGIIRGKNEGKH